MTVDLLLVNTPTGDYTEVPRGDYYTLPPLGLGSIATVCESRGLAVELLDAEMLGLSPHRVVEIVVEKKPRYVGLNLLPTQYRMVTNLSRVICQETKSRVLLGGPFCTVRPHQTLKQNRHVYAVVVGEGETSVPALVEGERRDAIPGVCFVEGDKTVMSEAHRVPDLDTLPPINRRFFVQEPCSTSWGAEVAISTSRGCPYSCIYCGANQVAGRRIRFRSVDNVIGEIEQLRAKLRVGAVYFVDDLLFINRRRVRDFATRMILRGLDIAWRGIARADVLAQEFDEESMSAIAESGCRQIMFGIDSGCHRVQKLIRKNLDLTMVERAIKVCSKFGIQTKGYFMLGFPTETEREMLETVRFAKDCGVDTAFFVPVRAFPGTEMYRSLVEEGVSADCLDEYDQLTNLIDDPATCEGLSAAGVDPDGLVKYNVVNRRGIASVSNEELVAIVKTAYRRFYAN